LLYLLKLHLLHCSFAHPTFFFLRFLILYLSGWTPICCFVFFFSFLFFSSFFLVIPYKYNVLSKVSHTQTVSIQNTEALKIR
jgi:hypothetical protein